MQISRIQIENFRNFHSLNVEVGPSIVIVGENAVGKSNFLFALRLILDPSLPDSARQLRREDFWDGLTEDRDLMKDDRITVSVDLTDFEDNDDQLALLAEHLVSADPMVARLTYSFQPLATLENDPVRDSDFEFLVYGGDRPENRVSSELRRRLPLDFWHALRDAEGDLSNWRQSPLRPLLDRAAAKIDHDTLEELASKVTEATSGIAETDAINEVQTSLEKKLKELVGAKNLLETALGFSPADPDRLIRALRLFIDRGARNISEASLGMANVIYLALQSLAIDLHIEEGNRCHTFLAIEEPEAHLHPHLQRRLFRTFLRRRQPDPEPPNEATAMDRHGATVLLSTHSPHLASVSPAESFVLLRRDRDEVSTTGVSTAALELNEEEVADIERYLDVTRGEALFARGIVFVEGEAEQYLVPVLAKVLGHDLDELGITVCSVAGTHFLSYAKFFGPKGLNIPFAIVTDADPNTPQPGLARVRKILEYLCPKPLAKATDDAAVEALANKYGIFITDETFEVALWKSGRRHSYSKTIAELGTGPAGKRAKNWTDDSKTFDQETMLKDIDGVGKGRFAQRWAHHIGVQGKPDLCPSSIKDALTNVINRIP